MNFAADKIFLLSTRKLKNSTVDAARKKNIFIEQKEFIRIVPVINSENVKKISKKNLPAIFTSLNAVECLNRNLEIFNSKLKIESGFAVNGRTAMAAEKQGIKILDTAGSASELAKKIIKINVDELNYFCGNRRRNELPELLRNAEMKLNEIVVYETILMNEKVDKNLFDGILFFSPSAVESFLIKNFLNENQKCFCIGKITADEVFSKSKNRNILTAVEPSEEKLVEKIFEYYGRNERT